MIFLILSWGSGSSTPCAPRVGSLSLDPISPLAFLPLCFCTPGIHTDRASCLCSCALGLTCVRLLFPFPHLKDIFHISSSQYLDKHPPVLGKEAWPASCSRVPVWNPCGLRWSPPNDLPLLIAANQLNTPFLPFPFYPSQSLLLLFHQ